MIQEYELTDIQSDTAVLDVLEERAELAHAEYNRVSELETKLRRSK